MDIDIEMSFDLDTGDVLAFYTRGHIEPAAFFAEAIDFTSEPISLSYVRHAWWRNVPNRGGGVRFVEAAKRGPGTYPVTVMDLGRFRADRALFNIVARNSLNLDLHHRRCCSPEQPCDWAVRVTALVERQTADLEEAQLRLGDEVSAERWATLIEHADPEMREHLVTLAPRLARRSPKQPPSPARTARRRQEPGFSTRQPGPLRSCDSATCNQGLEASTRVR